MKIELTRKTEEKEKPRKIVMHGCYSASNRDLGIKDKSGRIMNGYHDVFVVSKATKEGFVKVKTITSIESPSKLGEKRKFKNTKKDLVSSMYDGTIIVIPNKYLNTPKLSGIYTKGIWISRCKLKDNKYNTRLSKKYRDIIGK